MKEIMFFEGNHETIIMPKNASKTKVFYDYLYELFESKGYVYKVINTNSEKQLKENISEETCYLVGHSQGATRIIEQFDSKKYPQIKGIVIFDPAQKIQDRWNSLQIPKILFVGTIKQYYDYTGFKDKIDIEDDHYFSDSKEKVVGVMGEFIE